MPSPAIPEKAGIASALQSAPSFDEARIRTMPEKYIGAIPGRAPVVREIIEKKTVAPVAPKPPVPPKPPAKKKSRRMAIIIAAVVVLIAGAGSAAYIILSPKPAPPPPVNTNANTPPKPVCGNGNVETGEQCDLGSKNGTEGSTCSDACKTIVVPPPVVCGNGVLENGEDCDKGADNGKTDSGCSMECKVVAKTPPPPPNTCVDSDSDGLTDAEEKNIYGTDPYGLDTDKDTFNDGNEVAHLYDPMLKAPSMLAESNEVKAVQNKTQGYSVLVPAKWSYSGADSTELLATAPDGELLEVLVTPKPENQSLVEWHMALSPGTSSDEADRFKTLHGYDALRSPDRLTSYIDPGNGSIYTLTYSYDDQSCLSYRTTYEAFIGSFKLIEP
jgi:hypothetical protein